MENVNVLYYGSTEPLPRSRRLVAGPLTLNYERGDLRRIRLGDTEVVQRIYMAVRDRDWGTVPNEISGESIEAGEDWFRISYHAENCRDEIHFRWDALITGDPDGTIVFSFEGQAVTSFLQSRIGLCILHPMLECTGKRCRVERADGPSEDGILPVLITASQPLEPFAEMTGMSYPAGEDSMIVLRFSGDLFEMEDQRNWTDASYKTFCTPLRLGSPRPIEAGTSVRQSVTAQLSGGRLRRAARGGDARPITVSLDSTSETPLPPLGLCAPSHGACPSDEELARLRFLNLSHLRVDIKPSESGWRERLMSGVFCAGALGIPVEAALHLTGSAEAELDEIGALFRSGRAQVCRCMVFHTDEIVPSDAWIALARARLELTPGALIGSGTDADFFEINSRRPAHPSSEFLAYSLNPQTHAFDNVSLVETLPVQALTAKTAKEFAGGRPIFIGPVTLKMRFNPYAAAPPVTVAGVLPPQVDVRQMSLLCAGWTLGSVKYLAESGAVSGITYYETTGWRGVMETAAGSPPELFPSVPGTVFPVYHLFAAAAPLSGGDVLRGVSSAPRSVEVLAIKRGTRFRVLLANLTSEPQQVRIAAGPRRFGCRILDETSMPAALADPTDFWRGPCPDFDGPQLEIRPFALTILDAH